MTLGDGRKPVRVEFTECTRRWEPVPAALLGPGDIVRLPASKYAWLVLDVHPDNDAEGGPEVQLQLAARGLPVFPAEQELDRQAPRRLFEQA